MNKELVELSATLKNNSWFYDVDIDQSGRFVVYANQINSDIESQVPTKFNDRSVMLHFTASKIAKRDDFVENINLYRQIISVPEPEPELDLTDLAFLTKELDRLERLEGTNIVRDIFFEIHDGQNAVTNLSTKFPDIKESVFRLYETFGFDVIYEWFETLNIKTND